MGDRKEVVSSSVGNLHNATLYRLNKALMPYSKILFILFRLRNKLFILTLQETKNKSKKHSTRLHCGYLKDFLKTIIILMKRRNKYPAKPFIKWAGGKTQLLDDIEKNLPQDFNEREFTYVEPFVGGGSVMFWMLQRYPNITHAIINDINKKLITVYSAVKKNPELLIRRLKEIEKEYIPLNSDDRKEFFLFNRNKFNEDVLDNIEQSSLFIFLNRTCFNGLYRENSKGKFNVPHGRYSNPKICDEETIMADSEILQHVEILCGDFTKTQKYATEKSLFYLDPPYKPLNNTSSFNSYVKEVFDDKEQIRLRDFCNKVSLNGSSFILSNSDVKGKNPDDDFFDDLYAEYNIKRVFANRMVNANPEKRGRLTELIISNN